MGICERLRCTVFLKKNIRIVEETENSLRGVEGDVGGMTIV